MANTDDWFQKRSLAHTSMVPHAGPGTAEFFLTLKGQKQGQIKGETQKKGFEDRIYVVNWEHAIMSPRDPASGLPTGKRMHGPFRIRAAIGKHSPLLANVLVNNENVTEWELQCFIAERKQATGAQSRMVNYFTIKLTNANIASIQWSGGWFEGNPLEDIWFTYQKIEWTIVAGGITAMDDWEAPAA